MATFWAEALGYELEPPPEPHATWRAYWVSVGVPAEELGDGDGHDSIVDSQGVRPRVWFQQVPEAKTIKNRLHFDVLVGGGRSVPLDERKRLVHAEAERLIGHGARQRHVMDNTESNHYAIAMADPEGNEFDIV
jgi:hypothetical protein